MIRKHIFQYKLYHNISRFYGNQSTSSGILDLPSDHEKSRYSNKEAENLNDKNYINSSILDLPSDHQKVKRDPQLDFSEYNLDFEKPESSKFRNGVFRQNQLDDIRILVENFTAPALAAALRDRENILQEAAMCLTEGNLDQLHNLLYPFQTKHVQKRRTRKHEFNIHSGLTRKELVIIQRYLHRMPRHVSPAASKRASIIIPLCNVNGVPSILFERRSGLVSTYKHQVCFPGGMLDESVDRTMIQTGLRELQEELGIPYENIEVLGILRCNWNEVSNFTGISVTPVIGYIGEFSELAFLPNK